MALINWPQWTKINIGTTFCWQGLLAIGGNWREVLLGIHEILSLDFLMTFQKIISMIPKSLGNEWDYIIGMFSYKWTSYGYSINVMLLYQYSIHPLTRLMSWPQKWITEKGYILYFQTNDTIDGNTQLHKVKLQKSTILFVFIWIECIYYR